MQESKQNDTKSRLLLPRIVGGLAAAAVVSLSIYSLFGRQFFLAEIVNNFRLQISIGIALAGVALYCTRLPTVATVQLVWLVFYAMPLYGNLLPGSNPPAGPSNFSLMSINVLGENLRREPVLAAIRSADADILLVNEYENEWIKPLLELEVSHPYFIKEPRWHGFGIALYSKHPIVKSEVHLITKDATDNPVVIAEISDGEQSFIVVGVHFLSPITKMKMKIRNRQMAEVAELINEQRQAKNLPVLLVGDFNCVAWSDFARQLLRDTNLRDSRQGFLYHGSFPADSSLICIPIDNAFVSEEIYVDDRTILPANSSDHYPLLLDFSITPAK